MLGVQWQFLISRPIKCSFQRGGESVYARCGFPEPCRDLVKRECPKMPSEFFVILLAWCKSRPLSFQLRECSTVEVLDNKNKFDNACCAVLKKCKLLGSYIKSRRHRLVVWLAHIDFCTPMLCWTCSMSCRGWLCLVKWFFKSWQRFYLNRLGNNYRSRSFLSQ